MARSEEQIRQDLQTAILQIDPEADVLQGPVLDAFIRPVAGPFSQLELTLDDIRGFYSVDFAAQMVTRDPLPLIRLGVANFGMQRLEGEPSYGYQVFYTTRKPGLTEVIRVQPGYIFSTEDGAISAQTIELGEINGASESSYYSPIRRRWEIKVRSQTLQIGLEQSVLPNRFTKMSSSISGITGTTNITAYEPGEEAETYEQYATRIKRRLAGLDPRTGGGIQSMALNYGARTIKDALPVYSTDSQFSRPVLRAAMDLYIIGQDPVDHTMTLVGVGGETQLVLDDPPVLSVTSVTLNGSACAYSFVPDVALASRYSSQAVDIITFAPLSAGDEITVTYTSNQLIQEIQALGDSGFQDFGVDFLVRQAERPVVYLDFVVGVLSAYDSDSIIDQLQEAAISYLTREIFRFDTAGYITTANVIDELRARVTGFSSIDILAFHRADGFSDVEVVEIRKNEQLYASSATVTVRVK